jgi:NHL repeat
MSSVAQFCSTEGLQNGLPGNFKRYIRIFQVYFFAVISTFNESFNFQERSQGPIPVDTVLILDPQTGMIERSWGRNLFYMPHGITICIHTGDVWLTDVAMHQVFKVSGIFELLFLFGNHKQHKKT